MREVRVGRAPPRAVQRRQVGLRPGRDRALDPEQRCRGGGVHRLAVEGAPRAGVPGDGVALEEPDEDVDVLAPVVSRDLPMRRVVAAHREAALLERRGLDGQPVAEGRGLVGLEADDDVEVVVVGDERPVAHHREHRAEAEADVRGDLAQRLRRPRRPTGRRPPARRETRSGTHTSGPWMVHSSRRDGSRSALTTSLKALTTSASRSASSSRRARGGIVAPEDVDQHGHQGLDLRVARGRGRGPPRPPAVPCGGGRRRTGRGVATACATMTRSRWARVAVAFATFRSRTSVRRTGRANRTSIQLSASFCVCTVVPSGWSQSKSRPASKCSP